MNGVKLKKEQDKAYKEFNKFVDKVIEKSVHFYNTSESDFQNKGNALQDLTQLLHEHFNWLSVLNANEIKSIAENVKERSN
tara:strand:+ start:570 stop:812 length:243 start_codon:yes stop_codon:yes gene_type:complete